MTDEANVLVGCGVMGPLNPGQESNPEVPPSFESPGGGALGTDALVFYREIKIFCEKSVENF